MNTLDEFARKYGTDKQKRFHNYTEHYARHFDGIRHEVASVLEIGVHEGGSLRMWEEYFPKATIYGVDIDPSCTRSEKGRVRILIGDQTDPNLLSRMPGKRFDVIVDDGGHTMSQQISSFKMLFPALVPGGFYAIEDICTSYDQSLWLPFKDSGKYTAMDFAKGLIDHVNKFGRVGRRDGELALNHEATLRQIEDTDGSVSFYEEEIEAIHFYTGLVVVRRRPDSESSVSP